MPDSTKALCVLAKKKSTWQLLAVSGGGWGLRPAMTCARVCRHMACWILVPGPDDWLCAAAWLLNNDTFARTDLSKHAPGDHCEATAPVDDSEELFKNISIGPEA